MIEPNRFKKRELKSRFLQNINREGKDQNIEDKNKSKTLKIANNFGQKSKHEGNQLESSAISQQSQ